jgi:hypothetical protein
MGPNVLFMCIIALSYHLSVQFLDIDVQEISGKHPENSGNLLTQTGFYFSKIYILRLVFISWKFAFSDWFLFPGNFPAERL